MTPADAYIHSLRSSVSKTAMTSNLNSIVKILTKGEVKHYANYEWNGLSEYDVNEIMSHLYELHRSPKTINNYLSCLKGVAKMLMKQDIISAKDFKCIMDIKGSSGSHQKKGRRLEIEEINALIETCFSNEGNKSLRDAVMMTIMYGAGLRRSETLKLSVSSYDEDSGILLIRGKGNKARKIKLNNRAKDMLESWLEVRGRTEGPLFLKVRKGGGIVAQPLSGQAIYNVIVERYKEAGLKRLSPHDLRHSFASNLLSSGTNIKVVQELLGHENLETTANYLHIKEEERNKASAGLEF